MQVTIDNLGEYGVVNDIKDTEIPPNAFTKAQNIDFQNTGASKARGATEIDNSLLVRPEWLFPYRDPESEAFHWIYCGLGNNGLSHICTWDGTTHVTRTRGAEVVDVADTGYTRRTWQSPHNVPWSGGILNGMAFVNTGGDIPQKWDRSGGVLNPDFEDFTNWPVGWTARIMRPFGNFIIAMDINDTGLSPTRNPYRIAWSDAASPFTEPSTWLAGPTNKAGDIVLSESGGYLQEALTLRDRLIIYRQNETNLMTFVGGNQVMKMEPLFREFGALTHRCAKSFGDGMHFVFSPAGSFIHNGNTFTDVTHNKIQNVILGEIDSDAYVNSYVVPIHNSDEIWVVYPTTGNVVPNKAARFNTKTGAWSFLHASGLMHTAYGAIPAGSVYSDWDTDTGTWDSDTSSWNEANANATLQQPMVAFRDTAVSDVKANAKFLLAEDGNLFNGSDMVAKLERTGLSHINAGGSLTQDTVNHKEIGELWPQITGGPVSISVGAAHTPNGPYTWDGPHVFNPATDDKVDVRTDGLYYGYRIESNDNVAWQCDGVTFVLNVVSGDRGR